MKAQVKITGIEVVNELSSYWNDSDYIHLLKELEFPDAENSKPEELQELVYMALTDFEPNEAASILLNYKLGDKLTEGQIHSVSHEMIEDRVAEEYPDPALHYDLFNINQLLYKAYNGKFPNTEASIIKLDIHSNHHLEINNETLLKILCGSLSQRSLVIRLYPLQINGEAPFEDAGKIIWRFKNIGGETYEIITSKYWIEQEDIVQMEYETTIKFHEAEES